MLNKNNFKIKRIMLNKKNFKYIFYNKLQTIMNLDALKNKFTEAYLYYISNFNFNSNSAISISFIWYESLIFGLAPPFNI